MRMGSEINGNQVTKGIICYPNKFGSYSALQRSKLTDIISKLAPYLNLQSSFFEFYYSQLPQGPR